MGFNSGFKGLIYLKYLFCLYASFKYNVKKQISHIFLTKECLVEVLG